MKKRKVAPLSTLKFVWMEWEGGKEQIYLK